MADGRIVTLTGVRHVLGLRKNLISLGTLDSRGCRFSSKNGVLRVYKGDKEMLQGKMVGNLYRLQGRVEMKRANIGHQESKEERRRVTQAWRVKMQANESQGAEGNIEKEVARATSFEGVDKVTSCSRRRVTFATNLVSDVFG
jgi:hypothetical protein